MLTFEIKSISLGDQKGGKIRAKKTPSKPHEVITLDSPTGAVINWFSLVERCFAREKKRWIMTSD